MTATEEAFTGVLTVAPDGRPLRSPMLVDRRPGGWAVFTCATCGQQISFVNATAQRVQWFATSHRCGGSSWQR